MAQNAALNLLLHVRAHRPNARAFAPMPTMLERRQGGSGEYTGYTLYFTACRPTASETPVYCYNKNWTGRLLSVNPLLSALFGRDRHVSKRSPAAGRRSSLPPRPVSFRRRRRCAKFSVDFNALTWSVGARDVTPKLYAPIRRVAAYSCQVAVGDAPSGRHEERG